MSQILVISGHPDLKNSLANRTILEELAQSDMPIRVRRLDLLGWDLPVAEEQDCLRQADIIVFQFPFYWYSCTALLRNYMEKVLSHGFAYGSEGTALQGKKLVLSFTIGGAEKDYSSQGRHRHVIDEFLYTFQQTAALCGMVYEKPVYTFGCLYIPGISRKEDGERVEKASRLHGAELLEELRALS